MITKFGDRNMMGSFEPEHSFVGQEDFPWLTKIDLFWVHKTVQRLDISLNTFYIVF